MRRIVLAFVLACVSIPGVAAPCAGFTDLDSSSSFCANVAWMKNRGITLGCTATQYCPNDFVTRLQMAAFMYRLGFQNTLLNGGNAFGATAVLGTTDNQAVEAHAAGRRAMRYEPNSISPNVIGGPVANSVAAGVRGAVIAGGGVALGADPAFGDEGPNRVTAMYGSVGGGHSNRAGAESGDPINGALATVGGGKSNLAGGFASTVAGGQANTASGPWSTVTGGANNIASGYTSMVDGGGGNVASGDYGTVVGGSANIASGHYSFAAGTRAHALHERSFVWGGSYDADTLSQADGDFVVYAPGAVRLYAGPLGGGGCILSSGSSGWFCASDRALKSDIANVDAREVLERVATLPITRWSFTSVPGVMHMGPMAQDFHAAFELGDDPTRLAPMDVQGVALAAIQGLNAKLERRLTERDAVIAAQRAELHSQRRQLDELRRTVDALVQAAR